MTHLKKYQADSADVMLDTSDVAQIKDELAAIDIQFEQWSLAEPITNRMDESAVFRAYESDIQRICQQGGYQSYDCVHMQPDHPQRVAFREKFLDEHTHAEDEVRFFVKGSGLFYLHVAGVVYGVTMVEGDFIRIPSGVVHWFDMGEKPLFTALRFFTNPDGWVAQFTGADTAKRFPLYEAPSHP